MSSCDSEDNRTTATVKAVNNLNGNVSGTTSSSNNTYTAARTTSTSRNNTMAATKKNKSSTAGVADYFATLGVGETLVWKHTQKQQQHNNNTNNCNSHDEDEDDDTREKIQHGGETTKSNNSEEEEQIRMQMEEDAFMEKRFLREIVDVCIVTGSQQQQHQQQHDGNSIRVIPLHQHQARETTLSEAGSASSSVVTVPTALPTPNAVHLQTQVLHDAGGTSLALDTSLDNNEDLPPCPSSVDIQDSAVISDVTPTSAAGWHVIQSTLPASRSSSAGGNNAYSNTSTSPTSTTTGMMSMTTATTMGTIHTTTGNMSSTIVTQGGGGNTNPSSSFQWSRYQVWQANLNWTHGLYGQLTAGSGTSGSGGGGGGSGNAQHEPQNHSNPQKPLKELRRKMETTLRNWRSRKGEEEDDGDDEQEQEQEDDGGTTNNTSASTPFYLAYKRRQRPQDSDRPAIAQLELFYVRIHKASCLLQPPPPATTSTSPPSTTTNSTVSTIKSKQSSLPGLAGQLLERYQSAAAQVKHHPTVVEQQQQQQQQQHRKLNLDSEQEHHDKDNDDNHSQNLDDGDHDNHDDERNLVKLQDYLTLPDSFDEWSIPQDYCWIRDPHSVAAAANAAAAAATNAAQETNKNTNNNSSTHSSTTKTVLFATDNNGNDNDDAGIEAMEEAVVTTASSVSIMSEDAASLSSFSLTNAPTTFTATGIVGTNNATQHPPESEHWHYYLPKLIPQPMMIMVEDNDNAAATTTTTTTFDSSLPMSYNQHLFVHVPVVAVRRQQIRDEERYHEQDAAIVDLAVSFVDLQGQAVLPDGSFHSAENYYDGNKNDENDGDDDDDEEDEDGGSFRILGKAGWASASSSVSNSNYNNSNERPTCGCPVILARRNLPFGFADAAFATSVLDRFPFRNYTNLPLPEEELPMFCYPTGCRLHRARFSDAPLAEYYGFVVKNERGDSIYVSCVSFMEPLTKVKADQLAQMSEKRRAYSLPHRRFCEGRERRRKAADMLHQHHHHPSGGDDSFTDLEDSNFLLTGFDDMTTFEKKTICLVSRFPFWTAFRKFLSHLHILSTSTSELPLERYISHLLLAVPLPKPGGYNVIIPLPALNDPMVLYLPPEKDFPLVDIPFQRLVACIEIKSIVTIVLGLLVLERKVIVMSSRPSLVLDVCELLRSLLFPFELCAPYVPRLTEPFQSSLDFPGALFVGIHKDGSVNGLAERVRKIPPEDSILIDLDTGEVDCDGDRYEVISKSWDLIPSTARNVLVSELETLCRDAGLVDGQEPLDSQYDSAFDVALTAAVEDFGLISTTREPLDDRAIRDAFLRFFCAVLGGYDRFLVAPDADFLVSGNEWFDSQGFLASVSPERARYLGALVSTQLFQSFIQRRTEASDVHCLLFDECITEFHSSPVPYGRLGGDVETVPSFDNNSPPQMLYSLLVDQSATLPPSSTDMVLASNRSMDASEAGSSLNMSKASFSLADFSVKYGESAVNMSGDLVTAPSHQDLPFGKQRFMYCVDGNPCFPHRMNPELFLPAQPESWIVEMASNALSNPLLARSERELEDANRRRRKATSYRVANQRRCLWQLPKLMGSHFLGAWLLCIPVQVSQKHLSHDQQTRYLMRALGALRLLRSKQRIVPDEAAYRAMMVACGRTRSDRRVELVKLFGLLRSDGIFPSAVTLGQYTRALAEGYSKRSGGATQEEEYGGVEVTESSSRIGRLSIASINLKSTRDMETNLNGLDTTLGTLENHGRGWRHRNGILPGENKADQKKRSSNKTWLPVVYSTSFVPSNTDRQDQNVVRLVAMWSRTRGCSNCMYVPLEEEIQAGWDVVGGENETVACPRCGSLIVPMLGYKEMSLEESLAIENAEENASSGSSIADFGLLPPQIGPSVDAGNDDVCYVAYISPAALRLSLEQYVEELGEEVLARDRLKELDPEVFYNFWFYCARFSLPLPLPIPAAGDHNPLNYCAFVAWDRSAAERGCLSAAKVLSPILDSLNNPDHGSLNIPDEFDLESFDETPLLSRFNLQGFYSTVWDHVDLSAILVKLVEACDKRDFKPVVEAVLECNRRRREQYGPTDNYASSEVNSAIDQPANSDVGQVSASVELDVYRTILYLAKYQCTTAFHSFFPATVKPCKGYHFWCAIGTPLPIFDRLLRDGVERINNSRDRTVILPIQDVSEVAIGFRCVFGQLI